MPDTPQALTPEELAEWQQLYASSQVVRRVNDMHTATIAAKEEIIKAERETLRILREEIESETVLLARVICAEAERDALKAEVAQFREAAKSSLLVLCAAQHGQSWHENMNKDFTFAIEATRAALTPAKETDK